MAPHSLYVKNKAGWFFFRWLWLAAISISRAVYHLLLTYGKKNKNKEWAFKICSCFSFSDVCGIGSAQISSFWPVNQTHRQQRPSRAADWKEETVKEKKHQCAAEVSAVIADLGWTEREKNTLTFRVVLTQMGEYSYSAQTPTHTPHTHTHTLTHTSLFPSGSQSHVAFFCLTSIISRCVHVHTHTHSWAHARRLALSAASKAWAVSSGYISLQRWWMEDIKPISAGHLNRNEHRHWKRR